MSEASSYYDRYWEEGICGWHPHAALSLPMRALLERVARDRDVLDFGGGDGMRYGDVLRSVAASVAAADVSPAILARRESAGDTPVPLDAIGELTDEFDLVLLLEVLEHVLDPADALSMATGPLRTGGNVLVSVPNAFSLWNRVRMLSGRLPASGVGPPGVSGRTYTAPHIRFFDLHSLLNVMKSVGLVPLNAWSDALDVWKLSRFVPERLWSISLDRRSPLLPGTLIVLAHKPPHA